MVKSKGATTGAEIENQALADNRTLAVKPRKGGVAVLPGGVRREAKPYTPVTYDMQADARVLGEPESMLTDDWKREHIGWHYTWPIRTSNSTAAMLRAQWYVAVPFDALDEANPMAAIADIVTPSGRYIVWKSHILCAIPPEVWGNLVDKYEDFAVSRTVHFPEQFTDMMDRAYASKGFKSEFHKTDKRASRTGD